MHTLMSLPVHPLLLINGAIKPSGHATGDCFGDLFVEEVVITMNTIIRPPMKHFQLLWTLVIMWARLVCGLVLPLVSFIGFQEIGSSLV